MVLPVEKPMSLRAPGASAAPLHALHRTWLALLQRDWRFLVVVPADASISAGSITAPLAEIAKVYDFTSVVVREAFGTDLETAPTLTVQLVELVQSGSRVVAAIDCPLENASGLSLVMAADGVVLAVRYGATSLASARALVEMVGRERVLGCVAVAR